MFSTKIRPTGCGAIPDSTKLASSCSRCRVPVWFISREFPIDEADCLFAGLWKIGDGGALHHQLPPPPGVVIEFWRAFQDDSPCGSDTIFTVFFQAMDVRLRRALGLLRLGRGTEAVEAAIEAREEGGQHPLAPVSIAARLAVAGAKAACGGRLEADAVDELSALKVRL